MMKTGGSSWLNVVKKAFRSPAKDRDKNEKKSSRRREEQEQQEEEKKRGKRRWIFQKPLCYETTIQHDEAQNINLAPNSATNMLGGNLARTSALEVAKSQQQSAVAVAMATKVAAEAAVATAQAAVEIIRLTRPSILVRQQHAAILIQTAFRGYLARRALRALKGLVKLQALVRGYNVRKRAKTTLQCVQALIRLQAQACDQRKRLSCEGCASSTSNANSTWEFLATGRKSRDVKGSVDDDDQYTPPKKIHDLLQKTKEVASKPGMSLSQAFSQQMWKTGKTQVSASNEEYEENHRLYKFFDMINKQSEEISITSCDEKDSIKIVEIDSIRPCTHKSQNFPVTQVRDYQDYQQRPSSYTASSPLHRRYNFSIQPPVPQSHVRIKPIQVHSASPRCQREDRYSPAAQTPIRSNYSGRISANSVAALEPKYMAATVSANARVRSLSTPRQRTSTPLTEEKGSVKKRLSFTAADPYSDVDVSRLRWHHSLKNPRCTNIDICVEEEQRSYMSS